MKKIYFCGDTHLNVDLQKLKDFCKSTKLDKDDYIIQLGDIGVVWYKEQGFEEKDVINFYDSIPCKTLFIPGNHENYNRLLGDEFQQVHLNEVGGDVKQISDNLFMLLSGNFYIINDKKIACLRGAKSIDKQFRIRDISWWDAECISMDEYERAKKRFNCSTVDYFVSHTGSNNLRNKIFGRNGYSDTTEDMIGNILSRMEYKFHICGHYHVDVKSVQSKSISLYNKILSEDQILEELKLKSNILECVDD